MATITLYKDKLNGVGGLIDNIIKSSNSLGTQLGTLKSTLQGVSNSTYNLQDTVNSISSSSKTEKEKVNDLKKLNKQVTEFITTTVKRDNSARDEINKSKKDFYSKYNYLKPDCEKNAIEKIVDKVEKAYEWCAEHWKIVVTAIIVVVAVGLLLSGVGTGLGAAIIAGACWGAIFGATIGGVAGGLNSMKNGGSFLNGFENGSFDGAIGGMIGGAITGVLTFTIGPGMSLTSSVLKNSGIGALSSGSSNMVVSTINCIIGNKSLNESISDILRAGATGAISGFIAGGITGGMIHIKSKLNVSDSAFLNTNGEIDWESNAPNGGRVSGTIKFDNTLTKGTVIDRYGSKYGSYTSPVGTPFEQRALPYENNTWAYHKYKIIKDINGVTISEIASAFKQPGGGIQFELPASVDELIKEGFLKEIL